MASTSRRAQLYRAACLLLAVASFDAAAGQDAMPSTANASAGAELSFPTACDVADCDACSLDSSQECAQCRSGYFGYRYEYDLLSTRPLCLPCDGLGCDPLACQDLQGCAACPKGSVLTVDFKARATSKGGIISYATPARCRRCAADLLCATCDDWRGCTSCPERHALFSPPPHANYSSCLSCDALGCDACEEGVGCTSCPAGKFLFATDPALGGAVSCVDCAGLQCGGGWCLDNQGCSGCPAGHVLSQNTSAYPLPPTRCLGCTADLNCAKCNDQKGCTSCPAGRYRAAVGGFSELYPRHECRNCTELGCAACDPEAGCLACPEGHFLDNTTAPAACKPCTTSLNCNLCGLEGCTACSLGSYLSQSAAYPGRAECTRCEGCLDCSAKAGCTSCKPGYFLSNASALVGGAVARLGACVSEQASGCAGSVDGVGCTACLAGSFLYKNADLGYTTCCSSAELSCELTGDAGCKTCAPGYYRCYKVLPNRQVVVGCCPCNGCAKCQDFKGCTACSFNYTLTALPWDDPSVPCEDCTSFSCKPCGEVAAAACNECPTSMFNADPTATYLDCRECSTWLGCSMCRSGGCIACPRGTYLTKGTPGSAFGEGVTNCTPCNGCLEDTCVDYAGCVTCPSITSMLYGAAPYKRCYETGAAGLNCAASAEEIGCTACPAGSFLDRASSDAPWYCSPCLAALGCDECESLSGCTACPEGTTAKHLGTLWNDVVSCVLPSAL